MTEPDDDQFVLKPLAVLEFNKTYVLRLDRALSDAGHEALLSYLKRQGERVGCRFVVLPCFVSPVYGLEEVEAMDASSQQSNGASARGNHTA